MADLSPLNDPSLQRMREDQSRVLENPGALAQGFAHAPGTAYRYLTTRGLPGIGQDVVSLGKMIGSSFAENPGGFISDAVLAPLSAFRDVSEIRAVARQAREAGDLATADKMEQLAAMSVFGAIPVAGKGVKEGVKAAEKLAVKKAVKKASLAVERYAEPYFAPGSSERAANLAKFMEGAHPAVLNKDGTPKTLYHGTIADFPEFMTGHSSGRGTGSDSEYSKIKKLGNVHYFTSSPEDANFYAEAAKNPQRFDDEIKRIEESRLSGTKPMQHPPVEWLSLPARDMHVWDEARHNLYMPNSTMETGANVMPVHLSMKNPLVVDMKGKPNFGTNHIVRALKAGNDGVIFRNAITNDVSEPKKDHFIVFRPTQVKSAIGNRGTFDPNEPEIIKARGGRVSPLAVKRKGKK